MSLNRNRLVSLAAAGSVAALGAASLNAVVSVAGAAKPKPVTIELRSTSLGKALTTGSGFTVYVFTRDRRNRDSCVKVSGCTGTWPVIRTSARPRAGKGVRASLLGTITLAHGVKQVTYAGHPLYGYVGDTGPGQTDYVGTPEFGGTWYAISAAGKVIR